MTLKRNQFGAVLKRLQSKVPSTKLWEKLKLDSNPLSPTTTDVVKKGFFAVYVGDNLKRYSIPLAYLKHPLFVELLRRVEGEFGLHGGGSNGCGLCIPYETILFERLLSTCANHDDIDASQVEELLELLLSSS